MTIALSTKNQLGFINKTVTMPANQPHLAYWKRCNDMVMISWIPNTLDHDIRDSVLQTVLKFINYKRTQGSNDIATYFAKIKSNWDELNAINTIPSCTCEAAHAFAKREEDQRLFQFLVGLNRSYDMVRSNILIMQPLLSIDRAYGILIQYEKQKEIHTTITTYFTASSASMHANNGGPVSAGTGENRRTLVCTHWKRNVYSVNKFYKLIGFPKGYKFAKERSMLILLRNKEK
ncbi:uncharacterized protein LOC143631181 [Bidens hawaiensis]|uniref:uncharacterized protein LOC143631181 n=1 Tax=Bidens hawaiensis TaxID=980011 RepID=UPI00404B2065